MRISMVSVIVGPAALVLGISLIGCAADETSQKRAEQRMTPQARAEQRVTAQNRSDQHSSQKRAEQRTEQQLAKGGSAMGVPEPGTVADQESTEKTRDVSKVTPHEPGFESVMADRPYQFEGEVLKIDGEHFTLKRNDNGERVRLIVNQDTNLNCAAFPASRGKASQSITSDRSSSESQAPNASEEQIAQGQRKDETARGAGFRIGQCDFQPGDRVKAEVDDKGRATTLKYLDDSSR